MRRFLFLGALLVPVLASGCIVLDQVTTLTIHPDGSADVVLFHSNVRSTEEGIKAEEELRHYAEAFDRGTSDDLARIKKAGGKSTRATWLRREPPYATAVTAHVPDAAGLEKLATFEDEDGKTIVSTHFSRNGSRRKLLMVVLPPDDLDVSKPAESSPLETRRMRANGINETRIITDQGQILAARGWTIADDRRSALLALDEIQSLIQESPERTELFIEWVVPDPPPPQ